MVLPVALAPHQATWDELTSAFGFTAHRRAMIHTARSRIELILAQSIPLAAAWVNGSFVTSKATPSDIDVVVIVDGARLPCMWADGQLSLTEALTRLQRCEAERYEPGGTPGEHLTDFKYAYSYPEGHGFHLDSVSELDHWSRYWSRVKVKADAHTEDSPEYEEFEDSKGFVEVRWWA